MRILLDDEGRARLVNDTKSRAAVLHSRLIQPSELILVGEDGASVPLEDTRQNRKFDNTIYCSAFETLPPGGKLDLFRIESEEDGGTYAVRFGPFEGDELPSGLYRAKVRWTATATRCVDRETEASRDVEGPVTGTFESNVIDYRLP